jgi:hypothetical protein
VNWGDPTGQFLFLLPAASPAVAALGQAAIALTGGLAVAVGIDTAINVYNESTSDGEDEGVNTPHSSDPNPNRNPKQDRKLREGGDEIKKLIDSGEHPHDLKGSDATKNLFKDRKGNIYVKPKNGIGFGEPTGVNINDLCD